MLPGVPSEVKPPPEPPPAFPIYLEISLNKEIITF
jgi:hypothetical protein